MQKQFQAKTLDEAYQLATLHFQCSITDLEIEVSQSPSKGLFGLFAKEAIIVATKISSYTHQKPYKKVHQTPAKVVKKEDSKIVKELKKQPIQKDKIFDDFYHEKDFKEVHEKITIKKEEKQIIDEIKTKVNELFALTCFELDEIQVSFYDSETIFMQFDGSDAALLIGKEGYRYKALSYILFNWIHEHYNLMLRLEVAQFLSTQEDAIHNYLIPVIETIYTDGYCKTKPLDGVLVHIALKKLRDEFPQKYVAVKTNQNGEKYILVNEYRNNQ